MSVGPPKHTANSINGTDAATETFATKSANELPMAKMVSPMIAQLRPKMKLNVCRRY